MPRPPQVDPNLLRSLGFVEDFIKGIQKADDLVAKFKEARNSLEHFLLKETAPLHISSGENYHFYALAGALILHYAHMAASELMIYYRRYVEQFVARGTILIMPEDRDRCVINADHFWRTVNEAQNDETDEENEMRPMFISIAEQRAER